MTPIDTSTLVNGRCDLHGFAQIDDFPTIHINGEPSWHDGGDDSGDVSDVLEWTAAREIRNLLLIFGRSTEEFLWS